MGADNLGREECPIFYTFIHLLSYYPIPIIVCHLWVFDDLLPIKIYLSSLISASSLIMILMKSSCGVLYS